MYFFLSQRAMLFFEDTESQVTRISRTETYVRIIREVDAARIARFPVIFTPSVRNI